MGDSLKDLVILVTGASGAIGGATAVELAGWGAKLTLTGRNPEKLQITADRCRQAGLPENKIQQVLCDLTELGQVQRLMDSTIERWGKLDVLINIAGATLRRTIVDCEPEDLDWCYNALVRSVFMMTKAAIPHLEKTKGAIINMSSVAGLRPVHYALPYSMCKAMVDRFTQILATAVGPRGIRVNSVNPATLAKDYKPPPGVSPEKIAAYFDWCRRAIPAARLGEVEEVARLVAFLCSTEANYLNGALFPIDGSYSNTSFIPKLE